MTSFFKGHLLTLGYMLRPNGDYCIGGVGGGADIMAAYATGANSIRGIELDPTTANADRNEFKDYSNGVLTDPKVHITIGDARSVIRRSSEKYDVINFTGVDTITAVAAGAQILSESYLYTVEAVEDYFDHLKPGGILCLSAPDVYGSLGPPRMVPRFVAVAAEALRRRGIDNPNAYMVVVAAEIGTPAHASVLVKVEPFTDSDLDQLDAFVTQNGHHYWHSPRQSIDTPVSLIARSDTAEREAYFSSRTLDLRPVTDDKPFFFNFYRWSDILEMHELEDSGDYVSYLGPVGNFMLLGCMAFSFVAALFIIVVPAIIATRRNRRGARLRPFDLFYFCGIGLGFMLIEIPLMQRLVLFLGYPTYSLSVTLFSLLIFAGIGSFLSRNISTTTSRPVWMYFAALTALSLFHIFFGNPILKALLYLPLAARIAIAVVAIAPLGIILGAFFPIGIRDLGKRMPDVAPMAWAANGTCSVVGTFSAVLIANAIGFNYTFGVALLLYFVTALSYHMTRPQATTTADAAQV